MYKNLDKEWQHLWSQEPWTRMKELQKYFIHSYKFSSLVLSIEFLYLWNNYNLHYTSKEILSNFSFTISVL